MNNHEIYFSLILIIIRKLIIFFFSRITAKIDDDMLTYYCNEDLFLLEVTVVNKDLYDITFVELNDH